MGAPYDSREDSKSRAPGSGVARERVGGDRHSVLAVCSVRADLVQQFSRAATLLAFLVRGLAGEMRILWPAVSSRREFVVAELGRSPCH
jgi:hypothetical protein